MSGSDTVAYHFAPVIGFRSGSTGVVNAASCTGFCSQAAGPLDVVMVLDRTASMTQADVDNLKAGARSVLDFYDASEQWVGMVSLPYGQSSNKCAVNNPQNYPTPANPSLWWVVNIQGGYDQPNGDLDPNSPIGQAINCMQLANEPHGTGQRRGPHVRRDTRTSVTPWTRHAPCSPRRGARRAGGIIFETDGRRTSRTGSRRATI